MGFEQALPHRIGHVLEEASLRDASRRGDPWRGTLKREENHKEALLERGGDSNRQGTHPQKEPWKRKGSGEHVGKISGNKHDTDLRLATALTITLCFWECLWFTTHSGIEPGGNRAPLPQGTLPTRRPAVDPTHSPLPPTSVRRCRRRSLLPPGPTPELC